MKNKPGIFEWITFLIFIILEVVLVILRLVSPASETSQAENVLFSTFEIVFSLYIGYFIQKIDSAKQFQESLKQYGLSAYRRIMDIRKSVDRTIIQIDRIGKNYPREKLNEIDALRLILEGTFDTVESSILDWGDIIGPEIQKKERAELLKDELEKSQEKLNLNQADRETIEGLRRELNKINSELPLALKSNGMSKEREFEQLSSYMDYFEDSVYRNRSVDLYILLGDNFSAETFEKFISTEPIFCMMYEGIGWCPVTGKDGANNQIGELVNPRTTLTRGEDMKIYLSALQSLLNWMKLNDKESQIRSSEPIYKLENLRYLSSKEDGRTVIVQLPYDLAVVYTPRG